MNCNKCNKEVTDKEVNISIKVYKQILCEKCFKNYEECEIQ